MAAEKQSPIYPNLDKVEEYVNGIELNGKYPLDGVNAEYMFVGSTCLASG